MYKIKELPEDFIVDEIMELRYDDEGSYSYYLLKKREMNTIDAVDRLARSFNLKRKFINFAGNKDKKALTSQHISISRGPEKDIKTQDMSLKFLGKGSERINLGSHWGNSFDIVVRNINCAPNKLTKIKNLYGDQRFGARKNNHLVGKHILCRDYAEAIREIDDRKASEHLSENPNDLIGALRKIDKSLLRMYIHAYQSYLWNRLAAEAEDESYLSLPGFETNDPKIDSLLAEDGLKAADFLIRPIPELSEQGGRRKLYAELYDLQISELEDDERNTGMKKIRVCFALEKGSYATEAIRQMFEAL
mgnify:CR=1 FL=1